MSSEALYAFQQALVVSPSNYSNARNLLATVPSSKVEKVSRSDLPQSKYPGVSFDRKTVSCGSTYWNQASSYCKLTSARLSVEPPLDLNFLELANLRPRTVLQCTEQVEGPGPA